MRCSPLLLLAQAAALSSAFLIPPEITEEQLKELALPIDIGSGLALSKISMSRIVRIPCDGCKYVEDGVATDLVLDFNLPENHHSELTLNGHRILPLEDVQLAPLKATQMPHDLATVMYFVDKSKFPTVSLDNTLLVSTDYAGNDGTKQYTVEANILGVDGAPVQVQGVRMIVIEDAMGELTFGRVDPLPKGMFKACGMDVKCIFKQMMEKFRSTKLRFSGKKGPCKGRKGKHGNAVVEGLEGLDIPPPHHRHGWHGHHGHHGHKGRPGFHHRIHGSPDVHHNIFFRIIAQVLIPIFVGIAAGMAVSLVGLFIGHGFVMLYHRFKAAGCRRRGEGRRAGFFSRRCRERRERRRRAAQEGDEEDQKALLQEEKTEAPPAYHDEGIEVVEKE